MQGVGKTQIPRGKPGLPRPGDGVAFRYPILAPGQSGDIFGVRSCAAKMQRVLQSGRWLWLALHDLSGPEFVSPSARLLGPLAGAV